MIVREAVRLRPEDGFNAGARHQKLSHFVHSLAARALEQSVHFCLGMGTGTTKRGFTNEKFEQLQTRSCFRTSLILSTNKPTESEHEVTDE